MQKHLILLLVTFFPLVCFSQIIKKPIPDKLVVLTFDDAPASHYSLVAPLLKEHGFAATFFVCEFPPNYADSSLYMNWRQIQTLDKMGFEIGNHTQSHTHVDQLNEDEIKFQLSYIENKCDSLEISSPKSFAYPGYGLDSLSLRVLDSKDYDFARAGGSRAYDPLKDHPFLIPSWAPQAENKNEIMAALQEAKNGKIVVLTFHGVPDLEHPWVNTPPELFKSYLEYLSKHNYKVIALKDLKEFINIPLAKKLHPDLSKSLKN
ncbi:polysaccharide deacetylase family protein [Echinicola sp. 20G]|uniref:polysaccharide deacetylase family protein n=1 Tax=Echinicola sp. 20G TaxID=2781961 RepID=UPI0019108654|nr:polysaccharide deacetylase family protein [Echinicola sp. 20G]